MPSPVYAPIRVDASSERATEISKHYSHLEIGIPGDPECTPT
jgi:hypothetical protein